MNKVKQWLSRFFKIRTLKDVIKESHAIITSSERLKEGDYVIVRGGFAPGFYVISIETRPSGLNYYKLLPDDYRAELSGCKCDEDGYYYIEENCLHGLLKFVDR